MNGDNRKGVNIMLHSKFVALNLVKAAVIALLILSCIPFVGCGKADKKADEVDMLIQGLKDKNEGVRRMAAVALGEIKDTRAVEPLIAALKDNDRSVRWNAAGALGKINDARAVEPLIAELKDVDSGARLDAARALGERKDTRAVEPLIAELKDDDIGVRREAAGALEKIGGPSLIKSLKDSKELLIR